MAERANNTISQKGLAILDLFINIEATLEAFREPATWGMFTPEERAQVNAALKTLLEMTGRKLGQLPH
ncbi:MAG: hypothetical protein ABFD77_09545 [Thermotogota bacterium]